MQLHLFMESMDDACTEFKITWATDETPHKGQKWHVVVPLTHEVWQQIWTLLLCALKELQQHKLFIMLLLAMKKDRIDAIGEKICCHACWSTAMFVLQNQPACWLIGFWCWSAHEPHMKTPLIWQCVTKTFPQHMDQNHGRSAMQQTGGSEAWHQIQCWMKNCKTWRRDKPVTRQTQTLVGHPHKKRWKRNKKNATGGLANRTPSCPILLLVSCWFLTAAVTSTSTHHPQVADPPGLSDSVLFFVDVDQPQQLCLSQQRSCAESQQCHKSEWCNRNCRVKLSATKPRQFWEWSQTTMFDLTEDGQLTPHVVSNWFKAW